MIFCIFMYKMTYKSDACQVFIPCYIHVSVNVYEAYVTKINHSLTYLLINNKDYVSISDWYIDVYICTHRILIALSWWLAAAHIWPSWPRCEPRGFKIGHCKCVNFGVWIANDIWWLYSDKCTSFYFLVNVSVCVNLSPFAATFSISKCLKILFNGWTFGS